MISKSLKRPGHCSNWSRQATLFVVVSTTKYLVWRLQFKQWPGRLRQECMQNPLMGVIYMPQKIAFKYTRLNPDRTVKSKEKYGMSVVQYDNSN